MERSNKGMSGHQSSSSVTNVWITPREITNALGAFDLDPCCHQDHPWPIGKTRYYLPTDGLQQPWFGRVWLNPPYSTKECDRWLAKMADHGRGIALVFARTETQWFHQHVWKKASAIFFIEGRLHFHHLDGSRAHGNAGAPSCLVAYSLDDAKALAISGIQGHFQQL